MPNIQKNVQMAQDSWSGAPQNQQRYSPLGDYVKNQNITKEMQKRMNNNNSAVG